MIIVEGPDGSGKSTLINKLVGEFNLSVKSGEGPPKDSQDFKDRVDRYLSMPIDTIFDRHPVISGPIYSVMRGEKAGLTKAQLIDFYSRPKLVLIAHPKNVDIFSHTAKVYDTPEHLAMVEAKRDRIHSMYMSLSKLPDYYLVDPLGPWATISSLVGDFVSKVK